MPKQFLDWSELLEKGKIEENPIDKARRESLNLSKGDVSQKGGDKVTREQLIKEALDIVKQAHITPGMRQPTDEEMFGHLTLTQEEADKLQKAWDEKMNDGYKELNRDIGDGPLAKSDDWASGKSFDEQMDLTEEERQARNMYVKE